MSWWSAPPKRSIRWILLERHRGHFYNWYDTRTLAPLMPRYVSTVDSGNLSAHLLTLRPVSGAGGSSGHRSSRCSSDSAMPAACWWSCWETGFRRICSVR